MKYFYWPIFFLAVFLVMCKTPEHTVKKEKKNQTNENLLVKNEESELKYHYLVLKGSGKFIDEDNKSTETFKYKIILVRDSIIFVQVHKLGVEGLRMVTRSDSIIGLDKINKVVMMGDFERLAEIIGTDVDLHSLQNILTGNTGFIEDSLDAKPKDNVPYCYVGKRKQTDLTWCISAENYKLTKLESENGNKNQKAYVSYANFESANDQLIPRFVLFQVEKPIKKAIELRHEEVIIDGDVPNIKFKIPEGYEYKPM